MSANRQLKRHHACHECRTKKLKCSGDRPVCDGCKRRQDHHAASGSRRPVPQCTYDFAPGEEVWVHWNMSSAGSTTSRSIGKRTPSPPNDSKSRCPRTPTMPPVKEAQLSRTIQRNLPKSRGTPLSPFGLPETPPYPDPFSTHFSPCNTFLATGIPYTHNNPLGLSGLPHNTTLAIDYTSSETFFTAGSYNQDLQAPASISSPDAVENEYLYPPTAYPGSLPTVALLGNGIMRWM